MEGVFVSALLTLLLSDTWVTEAEGGEVTIAGRVAGIEGWDNVGEGLLCRPRTKVGDAWGRNEVRLEDLTIFRHERDGLNMSFKDSR